MPSKKCLSAPDMYPMLAGVPSRYPSAPSTSTADAVSAGLVTTSTPSMSSWPAPASTASSIACMDGEEVWWTISSRAIAQRHYPDVMRPAGAALGDFCCVLLFVVIGRANHHAGGALAGLWDTFWPFAAGAAAGMALTRFWRRPTALVPTGVGVWLATVAVGMALRVLAGP